MSENEQDNTQIQILEQHSMTEIHNWAFLGRRALLTPGGALVPFYFPVKKIIGKLVIYDTSSIREPPKVS
jgi:hypothetical protein